MSAESQRVGHWCPHCNTRIVGENEWTLMKAVAVHLSEDAECKLRQPKPVAFEPLKGKQQALDLAPPRGLPPEPPKKDAWAAPKQWFTREAGAQFLPTEKLRKREHRVAQRAAKEAAKEAEKLKNASKIGGGK